MAAFIISTFRFLVYLLFFVITFGGAVLGYSMAFEQGYQPWFGAGVGLLLGFFNAVVVTGIMVILLDIQDSLHDLAARSPEDEAAHVHHHHHHEDEAMDEPARAAPVRQSRRRPA